MALNLLDCYRFSLSEDWPLISGHCTPREAKVKMWTCGPDVLTGKGLGLGFMLRVRVTGSIRVRIKVGVSSSILPYCRSAGLQSAFYPLPPRGALNAEWSECRTK